MYLNKRLSIALALSLWSGSTLMGLSLGSLWLIQLVIPPVQTTPSVPSYVGPFYDCRSFNFKASLQVAALVKNPSDIEAVNFHQYEEATVIKITTGESDFYFVCPKTVVTITKIPGQLKTPSGSALAAAEK